MPPCTESSTLKSNRTMERLLTSNLSHFAAMSCGARTPPAARLRQSRSRSRSLRPAAAPCSRLASLEMERPHRFIVYSLFCCLSPSPETRLPRLGVPQFALVPAEVRGLTTEDEARRGSRSRRDEPSRPDRRTDLIAPHTVQASECNTPPAHSTARHTGDEYTDTSTAYPIDGRLVLRICPSSSSMPLLPVQPKRCRTAPATTGKRTTRAHSHPAADETKPRPPVIRVMRLRPATANSVAPPSDAAAEWSDRWSEAVEDLTPPSSANTSFNSEYSSISLGTCPICDATYPEYQLDAHIDFCLTDDG